jgi:predicted nuclease of predicted toxin-antitoxin system
MKLFATLYLDEDVSALVATLLRARGIEVTTVREKDRLGEPDEDQLAFATALGCCILTHNRLDFEELHRQYIASGKRHPGIVIASRRSPYEIARRVAILLDTLTADEIEGQLLYV